MQEFKNDKPIAILLATYNGELYLREQLDSLYNQNFKDWNLYIRDDGSSDNTFFIIQEYLKLYSNIYFVDNHEKHVGAKFIFCKLLEVVNSQYYMFCDQDDVWLPNKISLSYEYIKLAEYNYPDIPIVIHTDVQLVDSSLKIIENSFWSSSKINPDRMKSYNYLAVCSYVLGCTMIFNKQTKDISFPLDNNLLMHDWWISTRTVKKGKLFSLYLPTILYRQHNNNVCGVSFGKDNNLISKLANIKSVLNDNYILYRKLKNNGYGSILKFLFFKIKISFKTKLHI